MSLHRGIDGSEPVRPEPVGTVEERRSTTTRVAEGTLACPSCDAPVALSGPVRPSAALSCPYCGVEGAVRDFLSLGAPTRPARVVVRVRVPLRWAARTR